MTTANISYGTSTSITFNLWGTAQDSSNLTAGRESANVDNTSTLAIDYLVGGFITTSASPTTGRMIEVWANGSYDGTTWGAGGSGNDQAFTPTGEKGQLKLLQIIATDSTANHRYEWGPLSIAQAFGGIVPKKWNLYVVHNTGQNLNSTSANFETKYTPIFYTSA